MTSPDSELYVQATLFLLEQMPPLLRENKGTFHRQIHLTNNYQYWRMFLYPGSSIAYTACSFEAIPEPPVVFYLVKGNKDYDAWRSDHSKTHIHREKINALCETSNVTFSYKVDNEDNYYFIFDSETRSVTEVTFSFSRVLYDVSANVSVVSECSIVLNDSTACQVPVSHTSKPVALLELATLAPEPMEWDADVRVNVSCSARVWLYVVISFSAIAFVAMLTLTAVLVYLCCCRNKNRRLPAPTEDAENNEETTHLISDKHENPSPPPYKPD